MSGDAALFRRIVANDLRLFWRGSQQSKARWASTGLGRLGILALLHLVAVGMLQSYGSFSAPRGGAEFVCLMLGLMLLMAGLQRSLEVLYNRGDLSLLLASPVPARVVLLTRLVDLWLTTILGTAMILLPLLDAAVFLFGWHWAWGWLAWFSASLVVTPLSLLLTLATVARIGARRARTALQMAGILFGLAAVVMMQAPSWMAGSARRGEQLATPGDYLHWFAVSPLQQLAAAAGGQWQWLLLLAGSGLLLFLLAWLVLARQFTRGAQSAAGDVGAATVSRSRGAAAAWRGAFVHGRWRLLWRKEVLLLRRDPLLLLRCSTQIISLIPALVGVFLLHRTAGMAGLALVAPGFVAVTLVTLMQANDEGHEFVAASPLSDRERTWAKAVAAAAPLVLFGWVMAAVVFALGARLPAVMVAIGATNNALAWAWVGACTSRPHSAEEKARNRPPRPVFWQTLLAMLLGGLGAGGVSAVDANQWAVGIGLFALASLCTSLLLLMRPRPMRLAS